MKAVYKGHEIEVKREKCLGGWGLMYYSVYRISDGYECICDFTEDTTPVREYMSYVKERVDAELAQPNPWGERV